MALLARDNNESAEAPSASAGRGSGLLATLALADSSLGGVGLLAGLPLLAATWALLSPAHVLSRTMTWDLLFNLAGAWQLHFGHVPHVDYHDPVGQLHFLLTAAGFHFFGPSPRAILVGMVIVAGVAVARRGRLALWRPWHRADHPLSR